MTDEEFDLYFSKLSTEELFEFMRSFATSIEFRVNGITQSYCLKCSKDELKAAIQQEMYQLKTGRE